MSAPSSQLGRLSLGSSMPPMTRSKSRAASSAPSIRPSDGESSSSYDSESESESYVSDQDAPSVIRSPTRLLYCLDKLSDEAKDHVRDVFTDPPKMNLQRCRRINDIYAFQMTELVTRSIRIRTSADGRSFHSCSCGGTESSDESDNVCSHLLWLMDQLLKHTLYFHNPNKPLNMTAAGFAEEMGDPFRAIENHQLDILAPSLHCPVLDMGSDGHLDETRVLESRELLASVYAGSSVDDFRPDIFDQPSLGSKILKRDDLDATVFRMLVDNGHFFHYFRSLSRSSDPINDPFRKLSQRIDRVLQTLDSSNISLSASESPTGIPWAANHILGCVSIIRSTIFSRDRPLRAAESLSAVSALIHILDAVVTRNKNLHNDSSRLERNLYLRLVGDRDQDFVIAELMLVPQAASQFLHNLERLLDRIESLGAPASYVHKFRILLDRLRTSRVGPNLKREGQGQDAGRHSKKMK